MSGSGDGDGGSGAGGVGERAGRVVRSISSFSSCALPCGQSWAQNIDTCVAHTASQPRGGEARVLSSLQKKVCVNMNERAHYEENLSYGRYAPIFLTHDTKQCDKSPLLFGTIFNALFLAFKATRAVGHTTISGPRIFACGFADDLVFFVFLAAACNVSWDWSLSLSND